MRSEWKKQTVLPTPRESPPPEDSSKKVPPVASSSSKKLDAQPEQAKPQPAATKVVAAKPVPIPPPPTTTSTQNGGGGSSDVDIDGGDRSDGEGDVDADGENMTEDMGLTYARDPESDEIVHQLERGLPRWEGLGTKGWSDNLTLVRYTPLPVESSIDRCFHRIDALSWF